MIEILVSCCDDAWWLTVVVFPALPEYLDVRTAATEHISSPLIISSATSREMGPPSPVRDSVRTTFTNGGKRLAPTSELRELISTAGRDTARPSH